MRLRIPKNIISKLYILYVFSITSIMGKLSVLINKFFHRKTLKIGTTPSVWGKINIKIVGDGSITIGDNVHMVSNANRSFITLYSRIQLTAYGKGQIVIGDKVALNGTVITSKKMIKIGDGSMIAPNVIIVDSDFHKQWPPESRFISSTDEWDEPVIIGKNVWVGMNTLIMKGVVIGDNSIIGAGSVVTGKIPHNCVAAGNPAKIVKNFNEN